ncbi:MAG: hypothetical protein Q8O72_03225 [Bacteroidales bacterium]|nr:hypothetical protein [Bacteroidales bacterium]
MANSIFSTYSTAENRVTSTILAVFEKLNTTTVTRILQVLMEDSTIELIEYVNQVKSSDSVPDGRIKGLFDYIIETKVVPNAIKKTQIKNHYKMLKYDFSRLLILTPDFDYPNVLKSLEPEITDKIIWGNFDKIIEGIDSVLQELILLIDREKFLLLELKEFIINERLIAEDYSRKALIVPAGKAWDFYKTYSIYRCQPNRTFKPTSFMGFYADQQIKEYFPKILGYIDNLNIQEEDLNNISVSVVNGVNESLIKNKLIQIKKKLQPEEWNGYYKYIILTELNDKETFKNGNPIDNDKTSYSDKGTAFVQKQTYLNLDEINGKKYTSEL